MSAIGHILLSPSKVQENAVCVSHSTLLLNSTVSMATEATQLCRIRPKRTLSLMSKYPTKHISTTYLSFQRCKGYFHRILFISMNHWFSAAYGLNWRTLWTETRGTCGHTQTHTRFSITATSSTLSRWACKERRTKHFLVSTQDCPRF